MRHLEFLKELLDFMRVRKRYWLAPIILVFMLFGLLLIFTETSVVAPFIYVLF